MTEPARNYQTIQQASIEGLDQIFDVVAEDLAEGQAVAGPGVAEGQAVAGPGVAEGQSVTLAKVAETLNITRRSALRLIQEGKLDGAKDGHGQWLVKTASLEKRLRAKTQSDSDAEQVGVHLAEGHGQAWPEGHLGGHDVLLKELLTKLEALTYRNGYLESQLSERQREIDDQKEQIKLLTDSQHKPGWWARFKKWCAGQ